MTHQAITPERLRQLREAETSHYQKLVSQVAQYRAQNPRPNKRVVQAARTVPATPAPETRVSPTSGQHSAPRTVLVPARAPRRSLDAPEAASIMRAPHARRYAALATTLARCPGLDPRDAAEILAVAARMAEPPACAVVGM